MEQPDNLTTILRKQQERQAIDDKHYVTATFRNVAGSAIEFTKTAKLLGKTVNLALATNLVDMYKDVPIEDVEAVSLFL